MRSDIRMWWLASEEITKIKERFKRQTFGLILVFYRYLGRTSLTGASPCASFVKWTLITLGIPQILHLIPFSLFIWCQFTTKALSLQETIIIIQSHPYILIDLSYQTVKCTQLVIQSSLKRILSKETQQIPSSYWLAANIWSRLQPGWGSVPSVQSSERRLWLVRSLWAGFMQNCAQTVILTFSFN